MLLPVCALLACLLAAAVVVVVVVVRIYRRRAQRSSDSRCFTVAETAQARRWRRDGEVRPASRASASLREARPASTVHAPSGVQAAGFGLCLSLANPLPRACWLRLARRESALEPSPEPTAALPLLLGSGAQC
jgi:hypothetical protein